MPNVANPADAKLQHVEDLRELLNRARNGDQSALPRVRAILQNPEAVELLGGNLARQVEKKFVANAAGDDLVLREALLRELEALRTELAGPSPTPVDRLLVERVVACWLQVQDADLRYASVQGENPPPAWNDWLQRRMDRTHRRYLSALRSLALVRRLARPLLLVNVAAKQGVKVVSGEKDTESGEPAAQPQPIVPPATPAGIERHTTTGSA